jgi:hypothetical protein
MKKIKTEKPAGKPPEKYHTDGPCVTWAAATDWDAVYAVPEGERLLETKPLIGWAVVGVRQEGTKRLAAEIVGVRAKLGDDLFLSGREGRFLGYCHVNVNAEELFRKDALAYRERRKQEEGKRKS